MTHAAVVARRRRQPLTPDQQSDADDYRERLTRAEWSCLHGVAVGSLVRPWCRTPACPLCRAAGSTRWRFLDTVNRIPASYR